MCSNVLSISTDARCLVITLGVQHELYYKDRTVLFSVRVTSHNRAKRDTQSHKNARSWLVWSILDEAAFSGPLALTYILVFTVCIPF